MNQERTINRKARTTTAKLGFAYYDSPIGLIEIGDNPASIIVPCHRVIGSDGGLTGYGGGVPRKQ